MGEDKHGRGRNTPPVDGNLPEVLIPGRERAFLPYFFRPAGVLQGGLGHDPDPRPTGWLSGSASL
jgi:hypothetical protein